MKGPRGIEVRRGKYREIERQTVRSLSSMVLVSVFWFFKFGFKYDLGLGILIVLDWIGLECIGLHLGFGLNSVLSKEFGIEWFLISDICVRFGFSFG